MALCVQAFPARMANKMHLRSPRMRAVSVGLDSSLAPWAPEVKYVLRTLLRLAGLPYQFEWVLDGVSPRGVDIYYGPRREECDVAVSIDWGGRGFGDVDQVEPRGVVQDSGLGWLDFRGTGKRDAGYGVRGDRLCIRNDRRSANQGSNDHEDVLSNRRQSRGGSAIAPKFSNRSTNAITAPSSNMVM